MDSYTAELLEGVALGGGGGVYAADGSKTARLPSQQHAVKPPVPPSSARPTNGSSVGAGAPIIYTHQLLGLAPRRGGGGGGGGVAAHPSPRRQPPHGENAVANAAVVPVGKASEAELQPPRGAVTSSAGLVAHQQQQQVIGRGTVRVEDLLSAIGIASSDGTNASVAADGYLDIHTPMQSKTANIAASSAAAAASSAKPSSAAWTGSGEREPVSRRPSAETAEGGRSPSPTASSASSSQAPTLTPQHSSAAEEGQRRKGAAAAVPPLDAAALDQKRRDSNASAIAGPSSAAVSALPPIAHNNNSNSTNIIGHGQQQQQQQLQPSSPRQPQQRMQQSVVSGSGRPPLAEAIRRGMEARSHWQHHPDGQQQHSPSSPLTVSSPLANANATPAPALSQPSASAPPASWRCGACGYHLLAMDSAGRPLTALPDAWGRPLATACPRCLAEHTDWAPAPLFDGYGDHANIAARTTGRVRYGAHRSVSTAHSVFSQHLRAAAAPQFPLRAYGQQPHSHFAAFGGSDASTSTDAHRLRGALRRGTAHAAAASPTSPRAASGGSAFATPERDVSGAEFRSGASSASAAPSPSSPTIAASAGGGPPLLSADTVRRLPLPFTTERDARLYQLTLGRPHPIAARYFDRSAYPSSTSNTAALQSSPLRNQSNTAQQHNNGSARRGGASSSSSGADSDSDEDREFLSAAAAVAALERNPTATAASPTAFSAASAATAAAAESVLSNGGKGARRRRPKARRSIYAPLPGPLQGLAHLTREGIFGADTGGTNNGSIGAPFGSLSSPRGGAGGSSQQPPPSRLRMLYHNAFSCPPTPRAEAEEEAAADDDEGEGHGGDASEGGGSGRDVGEDSDAATGEEVPRKANKKAKRSVFAVAPLIASDGGMATFSRASNFGNSSVMASAAAGVGPTTPSISHHHTVPSIFTSGGATWDTTGSFSTTTNAGGGGGGLIAALFSLTDEADLSSGNGNSNSAGGPLGLPYNNGRLSANGASAATVRRPQPPRGGAGASGGSLVSSTDIAAFTRQRSTIDAFVSGDSPSSSSAPFAPTPLSLHPADFHHEQHQQQQPRAGSAARGSMHAARYNESVAALVGAVATRGGGGGGGGGSVAGPFPSAPAEAAQWSPSDVVVLTAEAAALEKLKGRKWTFQCARCGRRLHRMDPFGFLIPLDRDRNGETRPLRCVGCGPRAAPHTDFIVVPLARAARLEVGGVAGTGASKGAGASGSRGASAAAAAGANFMSSSPTLESPSSPSFAGVSNTTPRRSLSSSPPAAHLVGGSAARRTPPRGGAPLRLSPSPQRRRQQSPASSPSPSQQHLVEGICNSGQQKVSSAAAYAKAAALERLLETA